MPYRTTPPTLAGRCMPQTTLIQVCCAAFAVIAHGSVSHFLLLGVLWAEWPSQIKILGKRHITPSLDYISSEER